MTIATLIAAGRLDERLLDAALARLQSARLGSWVEPGAAADLEFADSPSVVRATFEGWEGVDIIVHPPGPREKQLLVADMDSTIIGQECIDELADYAGVKPQVSVITERAMRGELDFTGALEERVALLKGLDVRVIDQCLSERIRPNPGAETLVRTMAKRGAKTILVSGGFTSFVQPIAKQVGFEQFEANVLGASNGKLTGATNGRIVDSIVKRQVLIDARDALGLRPNETMAIGDGANDGRMVAEAGLGVAFRAKPVLARIADARLDHHGLDALLWAQGIPSAEWFQT